MRVSVATSFLFDRESCFFNPRSHLLQRWIIVVRCDIRLLAGYIRLLDRPFVGCHVHHFSKDDRQT